MKIFDGRALAERKKRLLRGKRQKVSLVAICVGKNKASDIYLRLKKKAAVDLGVKFIRYDFPARLSIIKKLRDLIICLNADHSINGIMLQMPLPREWPEEQKRELIDAIDAYKDVDGLTSRNLGLLVKGEANFIPATAKAVWQILKETGINEKNIIGKNVCVIGKSNIVGKPIALLLTNMGATVTICHSRTKNIARYSKMADILVSATGKAKLVKANMVKKGAIVIDVGSPVGDVDFETVARKASFITPVPGGVGPMTVVCLFENLLIRSHRK